MRRIGVVVNPIAGMGGRVGLKGTDGKVAEARERGAEQRAPDRAHDALEALAATGADVELFTYGDPMGASLAREAGFDPVVVGHPENPDVTSSADTRAAVRAFVDHGVDGIGFVGGDGTAVDVAETLDELDDETPILGVPAGVKVYSSVFGVSPRAAGRILGSFSETEPAEVNDIDEDAFRGGEVVTELRAVATVPVADQRQSAKQLGGGTVETLAEGVAEGVRPGVTYVLGPGSTVGAIKAKLGFDGTTLGVDVWRDGDLLVADAAESDILDALGEENVIVVSPIGGQGFVFGRGNQQLSPAVIRHCDVEVVASRRKLDDIGTLRVDTGDSALDAELEGWLKVRVGRYERRLVEVVA
ncbi:MULTISPECIES: ATP-NAD kinase family protein [Haloarcula]|uniref:N-acetylglucosamine-1-phosphate uridyltransferase n=1 Tax=Haloarcula pellucida TaxID=1427151 RepID=A0A830GK45_9EURY|nr:MULTISPECIES: ATP-NAD kinase family protein [Halomicroarcula]MBX0347586.1 ATP-NAD kinase family protein [Halomicroarcula pellucida]MDS0276492.1 ATP-NAD kinase family protein [Halomicroarcula sp. S1AR25-4]GGN89413.1 N-acetylglucosamine-1-phosphate uridyltransferase [Halomicroarcula pellucida]